MEAKDVLQKDSQAYRKGGRRDAGDVVVPQTLPVRDEVALGAESVLPSAG